jgi:hypothetical protein
LPVAIGAMASTFDVARASGMAGYFNLTKYGKNPELIV